MKCHNYLWLLCLFWHPASAFLSPPPTGVLGLSRTSAICANSDANPLLLKKVAYLVGVASDDQDLDNMRQSLHTRGGFDTVHLLSQGDDDTSDDASTVYRFQKATGMLQLVSSSSADQEDDSAHNIPRWIPLVSDMEAVLITNGWSFLDPDESEPMSAFDVDAANLEGTYKPKWGQNSGFEDGSSLLVSSLGFDLTPMASNQIEEQAARLLRNDRTRATLLEGATDPPNSKETHNGIDLSGAAGQSDIPRGVFICPIGGLPLFSSLDVLPTTASSGWLAFARPISKDHVVLVVPEPNVDDRRIEVVCAKSRCHLGHFFARDGYCINASSLDFIRVGSLGECKETLLNPVSWRALDHASSPVQEQIRELTLANVPTEKIVFGAGCFWHVEAAFRRLPGVVTTATGYAGGTTIHPTYDVVCKQDTGHAEVVLVEFDPNVLSPRVMIDSFLALHNPTKVRAHGKHAPLIGQYRSCIFVLDPTMEKTVQEALQECGAQLQKEISTETRMMGDNLASWFWRAEERHQLHQEKCLDEGSIHTITTTLLLEDWLREYGRRTQSVIGSVEAINRTVQT